MHGVECDPSKHHNDGHYLTRTGPPRPDEDLNDYDHGWTQVTVVDTPTNAPNITLGELHVSYTIKLSKPRIWQSAHNIVPRWLLQDWVARGPQVSGLLPQVEANADNLRFRFAISKSDCETLLIAKQSTFDAKLVHVDMPLIAPATTPQTSTGILFPANMAGTFRVTFCISTTTSATLIHSLQGQIENIANQASQSTTSATPTLPPKDVDGYVNPWFITNIVGYSSHGPGFQTITGYTDIRLNVARDGVDNIFFFGFESQGNAKYNSVMLEVTGLNTSLQWRQDGSNDQNIMVDKNDQIVTF
jgi:hypothetical protein